MDPTGSVMRDLNGTTQLHLVVEKILLARADATIADGQGFTALHIASNFGHVGVVRTLIVDGPFGLVEQNSLEGLSCLHVASQNGRLETVKFLTQACSKVLLLKTTAYGSTCLQLASQQGHLAVAEYLVKAGGEALLFKTTPHGYS